MFDAASSAKRIPVYYYHFAQSVSSRSRQTDSLGIGSRENRLPRTRNGHELRHPSVGLSRSGILSNIAEVPVVSVTAARNADRSLTNTYPNFICSDEPAPCNRIKVCDHALLYATASDDLSFALRMCRYVDEEGIWCDPDVREALCRSVAAAIKKLPKTAAVTSEGVDGDWKVEGTNATEEQLWALDNLLQRWLDTEMDEVDEHFLDVEEDEEESGEEEEVLVVDAAEKEKVSVGGLHESGVVRCVPRRQMLADGPRLEGCT